MKYFLIIMTFIGIVTLTSCELPEEGLRVSYEVVAIDSVQMPTVFSFGETYDIPVYYKKPTDCHVFEGFNVTAQLNVRNISTVLARLDSSGECFEDNLREEQSLRFTAASNGSYVFRFFNGFDPNSNEETFIEYIVQVVE